MKSVFFPVVLLFSFAASAQHYYKDIVGTKETAEMMKAYTTNKVSRVVLKSYDENNTVNDDFYVEQTFSAPRQTLTTLTRSNTGHESVLVSFIDEKGNVVKTIDSSSIVVSSQKSNESEQHLWIYNNNQPARMLRIKNRVDTTLVTFKLDESGNIIEEQEKRKGVLSEPVYYYYDANNRLTDIVRYNKKAKRLLPEYMFEYSPSNQVIQKITVPSNSDDYLIWRYQYNGQGLKTKEVIYNKQKQLTGKVEYQYSFAS